MEEKDKTNHKKKRVKKNLLNNLISDTKKKINLDDVDINVGMIRSRIKNIRLMVSKRGLKSQMLPIEDTLVDIYNQMAGYSLSPELYSGITTCLLFDQIITNRKRCY